ncbi:hypothetical protein ABGB16_23210 [Micromonospora sp. B11E3]|uniref:hypothetical protein n=1 Tax=Micromonospora sp. B11E3 TaxID=3153562 RepID=UPI00325C6273
MDVTRVRWAVRATAAGLAVLGAAGLVRGEPRPAPAAAHVAATPTGSTVASPTPGMAAALPAWPPPGPRTLIEIGPGQVPARAGTREPVCSPGLGGGPLPGEDVWAFGLPADGATARFLAVTPLFATPDGGSVALALPSEGGVIADDRGASVAWVSVPAGWTLVGATATVAGDVDHFALAGLCPARAA